MESLTPPRLLGTLEVSMCSPFGVAVGGRGGDSRSA